MRTYLQAKAMAKSLRESLAGKNVPLSHSECLEIVAQQFGFGNWNVLAAKIDLETASREPRARAAAVSLNQVIPVLRVDSREAAREFYVEVLGFKFDWGLEANAERGFYAQVSRTDLQLHLTTDSPPQAGADVYFRMEGIDALYREVKSKLAAARALAIRETFYDARELGIEDPFGNRLRFVEINPPGVSAR
jgi:catechol 2,3-dioxygenase-like lactoylglutathione lyase family enzyme